jgi:GNAT superfamily N-acetyltransferase
MVVGMRELRPMRDADVEAVNDLSHVSFEDLTQRRGEPPYPRPSPESGHVRLRRLLETDPGGCWVVDGGNGEPAGAVLALVREGVWGLSLLVVRPTEQSRGLGGALLARALAYGDGARGGIILASPDPRGLRAYARAGFAMRQTTYATGIPRGVVPAPEVRPFTAADHAMAARVDRAVRGAAHGADLDALAASGAELLAFPERGYAVRRGGELKLLAAADEEAAAALLRTVLARVPDGTKAVVEWLTPAQGWGLDAVLAAGLELRPLGALFLRGETGTFSPYLPGGAYL